MSIREALDLVNSNKFITSQLTPEHTYCAFVPYRTG